MIFKLHIKTVGFTAPRSRSRKRDLRLRKTLLKSTGTYLQALNIVLFQGLRLHHVHLPRGGPGGCQTGPSFRPSLFFTPTLLGSFPFPTWVLPLFLRSFLHEVIPYFAHIDSWFIFWSRKAPSSVNHPFLQKVKLSQI